MINNIISLLNNIENTQIILQTKLKMKYVQNLKFLHVNNNTFAKLYMTALKYNFVY